VAASGIAGPRWGFEGFLPRSGRERRERLARIAADDRATVLFEAPTRLAVTLRDLAEACGADRRAAVCRELTKLHEQVARGTLAELARQVADGTIPARGEVAVVVAARADAGRSAAAADVDAELAASLVDALVRGGASRSEAARAVAAATGRPRRALYGQRKP
jgi:16S rRNA (cytidine1402-2'-O)-methyltransferase